MADTDGDGNIEGLPTVSFPPADTEPEPERTDEEIARAIAEMDLSLVGTDDKDDTKSESETNSR